MTHPPEPQAEPTGKALRLLTLGALGVVYGDIGTSPLYALRECFHGHHAIPVNEGNVLGVLSLIFWSMTLVVSYKYISIVMQADNRGEGGIMALMSLVKPRARRGTRERKELILLGLFGCALLYGDGMITPVISVLSAVEGLQVATPFFTPYVVPITIGILIALFLVQSRGTEKVGRMFGPIMLTWFGTIGVIGVYRILDYPAILRSLNPVWAIRYFADHGLPGFLILGSVFLVITGGEALYADMGHFGIKPIRRAWFGIVLGPLVLNYQGQGALLLTHPGTAENPFFRAAPDWALYPLVVLATLAACIASQALISGSFSLTRQAIQLNYCPRLGIEHTSESHIGQIYIPAVNYFLMASCIALTLGFKTSSNIAAAYGIAVTTTMVITTLLLYFVSREVWGWSLLKAGSMTAFFLFVDLAFFGANAVKIHQGGWVPLLMALVLFGLMTTWKTGRSILANRLTGETLPDDVFMQSLAVRKPLRVPGVAVFLDRSPEGIPPALLHNLKHNKVIHEKVVLLTVTTEEIPSVEPEDRYEIKPLGSGFWRITMSYGFMEIPHIPNALASLKIEGLKFDPMQVTYFLGRETLLATSRPGMALWRERLFAWMSKNATTASQFFGIPPNRVVELGIQVEL